MESIRQFCDDKNLTVIIGDTYFVKRRDKATRSKHFTKIEILDSWNKYQYKVFLLFFSVRGRENKKNTEN